MFLTRWAKCAQVLDETTFLVCRDASSGSLFKRCRENIALRAVWAASAVANESLVFQLGPNAKREAGKISSRETVVRKRAKWLSLARKKKSPAKSSRGFARPTFSSIPPFIRLFRFCLFRAFVCASSPLFVALSRMWPRSFVWWRAKWSTIVGLSGEFSPALIILVFGNLTDSTAMAGFFFLFYLELLFDRCVIFPGLVVILQFVGRILRFLHRD